MQELLNTLYVMTEHSYLHLDHDSVRLEVDRETKQRLPLVNLGGIVCFGNVLMSPALLMKCAEDGRTVTLLDSRGQFRARLEGPTNGNVLLRRAQHVAHGDLALTLAIARSIVAGKIQNSRQNLLRSGRDTAATEDKDRLAQAAETLAVTLGQVERCADIEALRGHEGEAARVYFAAFDAMTREDRVAFRFDGRSRRPPLNRTNALLSFLYTLLMHDCQAALEGVGLDPQVGFLHVLRPGRPALALDLMEELRPLLADRVALTLINRKQIQRDDFTEHPGGAVYLADTARKTVVAAYQTRKRDEAMHRMLDKKVPLGLVPHLQARILARHLRGDIPDYLPYLVR